MKTQGKFQTQKRWSCLLLFLFTVLSLHTNRSEACGMSMHQFMAELAIDKIPDKELREVLREQKDAYLMGAIFPDSGYVWQTYGEEAHWGPFFTVFRDYLRENCPQFIEGSECRKLTAFFFGIMAHGVGDVSFDTLYLSWARETELKDDPESQSIVDTGLDLVAVLEQKRANKVPPYWVPAELMSKLLKERGLDYPASHISQASLVAYGAIVGERAASPFTYLYYKLKAPKTFDPANYMHRPGGIIDSGNRIAVYLTKEWRRIQAQENDPIELSYQTPIPNALP